MAKVIRNGMYEGIYNAHSEACYALTAYRENILGELENIMRKMVGCSSIEEFKQLLENFESKYAENLIELDTLSEKYNMDAEPLKKLLKKFKRLLIARLSKGELPDEGYLRTQLVKFTNDFCSGDIPVDRSMGIADEFFSRGMSQRGEREEREEREVRVVDPREREEEEDRGGQ